VNQGSLLALSVVGGSIMAERAWRTWDRLRATPVRAGELLLGKAVPAFAMLAVQQAVVISFGVVVFGLQVRSLALVAAAVACWGAGPAGHRRDVRRDAAVAERASGGLRHRRRAAVRVRRRDGAATSLPGWAQAMAPASPGYWAMSALRSAMLGQVAGTVRAASVLLAIAAVMGTLAVWRISRGWARSRLL
jgi:ABC-2 type transport system permease protein